MEEKYRGETLVYGDFPRLFGLRVHGNVEQIGYLDRDMKDLQKSLFFGFASFTFSRVGYYDKTVYDNSCYIDGSEYLPEGRRTTDDTGEVWIRLFSTSLLVN